jgi:hypothetical protein
VVRIHVLPWGFFLEGEDTHGYHGLGSLLERRFKVPPGTSPPPQTVVTTPTEDGHKQHTNTATAIWTERKKEHRTTEKEMEGPTSS